MNEQVMMIRVAAVDLSGMVEETESLRYRLQQSEKARSEESQEWRDDSNELLRQFNGFRRAVQEALGFDQPELLHDDELIVRVKHAALCQLNVKGFPWKTFSVDVVERPRPDHVDDVLSYGKMLEREQATLADGTQARFFSDQRPDEGPRCGETAGHNQVCDEPVVDGHCQEHGDVGPPTESMPPVQEPPNVHGLTGEVITDRDSPHDMREWPSMLANRAAEVYEYVGTDGVEPVYRCHAVGASWTLAALLTMHGTLWIVDPNAGAVETPGTVWEVPPEIEGFKIGRVFTRGDSIPEGITGWWGVADRAKDVYEFTHNDADGSPVLTRGRDSWLVSWPELLHMHGTVWEAVPLTRDAQDGATAGEQVPGE